MNSISTSALLATLMLVGGCASVPSGPSVMALPGSGKNFEQFRADDADCRQYASGQVSGTTAEQASAEAGMRSAAIGTAIGAVAGAAIGGRDGAAAGAGTGLVVGSIAGSGAAQSSAYGAQHRYDNAYVQCMYAKGEKVPVSGTLANPRAPAPAEPVQPPSRNIPPPPPPR